MRATWLAGVVFVVAVTACRSDPGPLPPADVLTKVTAGCDAHKTTFAATVQPTAGPDFIKDSNAELAPFADDALSLVQTIRAQPDQRTKLDALYSAATDLTDDRFQAESSLEERDWPTAQTSIDKGKLDVKAVDAAAAALSLPDCSSATWVGTWFDQAQTYHDQQVQATKPTGDFMTDVTAACGRFDKDIAAAGFPTSAIDVASWAFGISAAVTVFVRDVSALEVPADKKSDVAALMTSADALSAQLTKVSNAALAGTNDAQKVIADTQAAIDDLTTKIAALGVSC